MSEIVKRLESARGPDRFLDRDIARSFEKFPTEPFEGEAPFPRLRGMYWVFGKKDTPDGPVDEKWSKNPPLYTSSIDAALTLVPADYGWRVDWKSQLTGSAWASAGKPGEQETAHGATPAIALCIAALNAANRAIAT